MRIASGMCGLIVLAAVSPAPADLAWSSQDRFRIILTVNPRAATRSHCPASVDLDFPKALSDAGGVGTFD